MRNLKKILALVLALVMSMSLLATANAFNDDAEIDPTYDEAVTVLANLGVFQGYNNGETFVPKGSITRAEVATILYRIATGDVDDTQVDIYADYNKFSDVKSTSWYAGYVNYCANAEYIKGYDDKTFGPNDPVTGYQALAMILRAVGYDANDEFTGNGWQVQVASYANQLGLTRNVSAGTLNTAATREVVAEILFRTIAEAYVVKYTAALGYQPVYLATSSNKPGSLVLFDGVNFGATLGGQTFGLARTAGEITAVGRTAGTTTLTPVTSVTTNGVTNDNALETNNAVVVTNTTTPWTSIGYVAYAYTVPTAGAKTRTAVSDVTVTGDSLGVSTSGSVWSNLYTAGRPGFVAPRDEADIRMYYNGVIVWDNGGWVARTTANAAALTAARALVTGQNAPIGRGVKVDFIDNDNSGITEVMAITEYTTAYVTGIALENNTGSNAIQKDTYYFNTVSDEVVTSATRHEAKVENLVCSDELAYNDLVTYVVYGGDTYATKAPVTTGAFTKITHQTVGVSASSIVYTIGGTDYLLVADKYWAGLKALLSITNAQTNKTLAVYTDPYGYALKVAEPTVATDYMFVMWNNDTDVPTRLTTAEIALTDGTTSRNTQISSVDTSWRFYEDNLTSSAVKNWGNTSGIYTYVSGTTSNYALNTVANSAVLADGTLRNKATTINLNGTAYPVTSETVVVDLRAYLLNGSAATVYTGWTEMPDINNAKGAFAWGADNTLDVIFLTGGTNASTSSFIVYDTSVRHDFVDGYHNVPVAKDGSPATQTLTTAEWETVQKYQTGVYSYDLNGKLTFTAFNENWSNIRWSRQLITIVDDRNAVQDYVRYDENTTFTVLDIKDGEIDTYGMVQGTDGYYWTGGQTVKAYITYSGSTAKNIYIIVGDLAAEDAANLVKDANGDAITKEAVVDGKLGAYKYYAAADKITNAVFQAYDTYTVNDVLTYHVGETATVEAEGPYVQVKNAATNAVYKYVKVEDGKASFKMPAYDVVTVDGYYAYKVDTTEKYVDSSKLNYNGNDAHVKMSDLDFTGATGNYYRVFADSYGVNPDDTSIVAVSNLGATASDVVNYYEVITTGLYKVIVGSAGGPAKNTADKDVYDDNGVLVPAGTVLTNGDDYYAFAGTTFTKVRDGHDNAYYTVPANASDYNF